MNDPKRWLDEGGGATFEERELLDAGRRAALPLPMRKRLWIGVAAGAAGLGAASEAAGAMGTAAVGKGVLAALAASTAAKSIVAVAIVGGAGLGVVALRSPSQPVPIATVAHASPPLHAPQSIEAQARVPEAPVAPSRHEAPVVIRGTSAAARASAPKPSSAARNAGARPSAVASSANEADGRAREAPAESRVASRLAEESAAVLAIRKTLLAGDAVESLRMLDRARAAFPSGALVEEREALAVRALVASHQNELARKRGEAFMRAFPRSPHASEVRAVLGP
jgi:hypothetical protein